MTDQVMTVVLLVILACGTVSAVRTFSRRARSRSRWSGSSYSDSGGNYVGDSGGSGDCGTGGDGGSSSSC
jgi:hypothetical protein